MFPIPKPERLPTRISPCPIIDAVLEIRFVTAEDWSVLPGLLYNNVRKKFPTKVLLPLSKLDEEFRNRNPQLRYQPLLEFRSELFRIRLGPRVISLSTLTTDYPGWSKIKEEMQWLLENLNACGLIGESERLGFRCVDFFEVDIFEHLILDICVNKTPLDGPEMSLTKVLHSGPLTSRLLLNNGAEVVSGQTVRRGSVLDLDVWLGPDDFELFTDGLERFDQAHQFNKEVFFGLLKNDFLTTLSPEYSD